MSFSGFRRKRTKIVDAEGNKTDSETEGEAVDASLMAPKGSSDKGSAERYNSKGIRVNSNNFPSLLHLPLANQVPAKTRDLSTEKFFGAALNLSKGYTMVTLILNGCKLPVEKQRDSVMRMIVLRTVAQYCLSKETLDIILNADPDEQINHLSGLARNSQQYIKYQLYGDVANFMADKVMTQHDVFPSDAVKKHLGLIGNLALKSFMNM